MARDKWGFGPYFPEHPTKQAVCTLTVPTQCRNRVKNLLFGYRVATGCVNRQTQTITYRVYNTRHTLDSVMAKLEATFTPFDLDDHGGFLDSYRCHPDGRYVMTTHMKADKLDRASWEGQWQLRKLLKTIRLINPDEFDPVEFM